MGLPSGFRVAHQRSATKAEEVFRARVKYM